MLVQMCNFVFGNATGRGEGICATPTSGNDSMAANGSYVCLKHFDKNASSPWLPATGSLQLAPCNWLPATGSLQLAPLQLAPCNWLPATGSLQLALEKTKMLLSGTKCFKHTIRCHGIIPTSGCGKFLRPFLYK